MHLAPMICPRPSLGVISWSVVRAKSRRERARERGIVLGDRAEHHLRICRDGRGLGSKLVWFAKRFSKHSHIFPILKVDSEYLRLPFTLKVDYFMLYSILVSTFAIFLLLFFYERKKTHERSVPAINSVVCKGFQNILTFSRFLRCFPNI